MEKKNHYICTHTFISSFEAFKIHLHLNDKILEMKILPGMPEICQV